MINNYYTLKALVDEIRDEMISSEIGACYTRIEHTLEIILRKGNSQPNVIVVSCKPHANSMFMRAAPRRHTGANVMHAAIGSSILSADVPENERTVKLSLSGERALQINLFGPHANVFLAAPSGEIEESFLKKKKPTTSHVSTESTISTDDPGEFVAGFEKSAGSPIQKLAALFPPFAGDLAKEAFYRTGGDDLVRSAKDTTYSFDRNTLDELYKNVSEIREELSRPLPRIYFDGDNPVMMSLIEMQRLASLREETYDSVNMCISVYSSNAERHLSEAETRHEISARLVRRKEDLVKTIAKIETDLSGNREAKYREYGNTLMSRLDAIEKGAEAFTDAGTGERIRLDPKLNAVQNAQAYFEKAKKARESHKQALSRRDLMKKSLTEVEEELGKLDSGLDRKRVASLLKSEKAKEKARTPFREFEINGYMIYVGKDARNNDTLTFGFAKPNDVFLHARGVSGSHVIIRNTSREYPQKPVLEFAARIAAHYSKARSSGVVPVAYTMRKYVKKAKGQPGAVLVDREEVIFVKPGIPQTTR